MIPLFLLLPGLQRGVILIGEPYGLPLHFTTLPQKLKEAGMNLFKWHGAIIGQIKARAESLNFLLSAVLDAVLVMFA